MSKDKDTLTYLREEGFAIINGTVYDPDGKPIISDYEGDDELEVVTVYMPVKIPVYKLAAFQKFGHKLFKENVGFRHKDGDAHNNRLSNLELVYDEPEPPQEIAPEPKQTKKPRKPRGPYKRRKPAHKNQGARKLTYEQFKEAMIARKNGATIFDVAMKAGINTGSMSVVLRGNSYKDYHKRYTEETGDGPLPKGESVRSNHNINQRKLTYVQYEEAFVAYHTGKTTIKALAEKHSMSPGVMSMMMSGQTYSDFFDRAEAHLKKSQKIKESRKKQPTKKQKQLTIREMEKAAKWQKRVRALINATGNSYVEMSEALGCDVSDVVGWDRGKAIPNKVHAKTIEEFEVSLELRNAI